MKLTTTHLKPSAVLRLDRYFGTYDRAIALIATEYTDHQTALDAAYLIADLFGIEVGQVTHDVMMACKRERRPDRTTVATARTLGPGHPTGGLIHLEE